MPVPVDQLTSQVLDFAVNRLTYSQFVEASCNTSVDQSTGELKGPIDPGLAYLSPSEFYMTVDEPLNPDFQLSAYVTLAQFFQTVSSTINFRGVTNDADWAAKLSAYAALSTADSPSDLYVHYDAGDPRISNENAPYDRPGHGDLVFYGGAGREFMYTRLSTAVAAANSNAIISGYWSEIGNDWMLSVIQATTSAAVEGLSTYVKGLSTYTGNLSTYVGEHTGNDKNPHGVTASQVSAYLCSETSSAGQIKAALERKLDLSLSVNAIDGSTRPGSIPDAGAVSAAAAEAASKPFVPAAMAEDPAVAGQISVALGPGRAVYRAKLDPGILGVVVTMDEAFSDDGGAYECTFVLDALDDSSLT